MRITKHSFSFVATTSAILLLAACGDDNSSHEKVLNVYSDEEWIPVKSSSSNAPEFTEGVLTDSRDGQTYKTVTIGTQTWMVENLNYAYIGIPYRYRANLDDSYVTFRYDSTSRCYDSDPANCAKYGRLYTWSAAMDSVGSWSANGKECGLGKKCTPTYPVRGVCPEDWHLPTQTEWDTLFNAVGGQSTAAKVLKSTSGWNIYNGTDDYGFSALPAGGISHEDLVYEEGSHAYFWSSTEFDSRDAYPVMMGRSHDFVFLDRSYKNSWFSVRCVKDDVTTVKSSSSTAKSSSSTVSSSSGVQSSSSVAFVEPCRTDSEDTCEYGTLSDGRDGQTYKTVKIGTQTWMAENLNYAYIGVPYRYSFAEVSDISDSTSWCYDNDPANCAKYGRLYTWSAAMDSTGMWSRAGERDCGFGWTCWPTYPVRGVCPEGWHLPTYAEWKTLFTAVGGEATAGKKLKSTSGWNDNLSGASGNGTDDYSFAALPVGRRGFNGVYEDEGIGAYFWSSNERDNSEAHDMSLFRDETAIYNNAEKLYGFSVRCVKD